MELFTFQDSLLDFYVVGEVSVQGFCTSDLRSRSSYYQAFSTELNFEKFFNFSGTHPLYKVRWLLTFPL